MKSGFLVYKCRRCGSLKKEIHVPKGMHALLSIINDMTFQTSQGFLCSTLVDICHCNDGNLGITDLIGFEEDN